METSGTGDGGHPHCAECGALIPDTALGAVCPACLMGGLWDDEPAQTGALFSIQGHEVVRELGRGGMGIVYLARQHDPPREVALKMLLPAQGLSPEMRERFRMEAATVAALDHPHILPVYATGEHDGLPWFTLKLASGGTLAERVGEYAGHPREAAGLVALIAEAVHFAHQRGVLHRDLKPGNVMFDGGGTPYVSDFGLAKWIGGEQSGRQALTTDGSTMGTPCYMSPEAAKKGAGAATAASDVYALGAILYELLAGRPPFTAASTPELMRSIYEDPAPRLPAGVPLDLAAVAMKCLEKEPAHRFESACALAADLRSWLEGRGVRARPAGPAARLWRWARRSPALAGMAAALLAALASGVGLQIRANHHLRNALAESLLSQARLTSMGTRQGARSTALQLLREADDHGAARSPGLAARRRKEIAAALALPELSQTAAWAVPSGSSHGGESFSPDLERYLAATPDGGFALYETASRTLLNAWPPADSERQERRRAPALRLNLSPDEKRAAVVFAGDSSTPARLRIVELATGRTLGEWPCDHDSREWPLWLPDGGFLFANSRTPCLRAGAGGEEARPFPDAGRAANVVPLALHPGGLRAVAGLKSEKALAAVDLADGREIWRTPLLALPGPVAWSEDGVLLAAGGHASATLPDEAGVARPGFGIVLLDAATGALRGELPGHTMPVAQLCFLHGSRSVVSVSSEEGMIWQETRGGGFHLQAPATPRALRADRSGGRLAWSPAQGALCTAAAILPSGWRLWEENAGGTVTCCASSADGARVFLATKQDLQIWDGATGRRLHRQEWPAEFTKSWPWFVVTPDGMQIIMGDQGQPLHVIPVTTAPDGTLRAALGTPQPRGPGREFYMIHGFTAQGGWVVCDAPAGRTVQRGRTYSIWPEGDPSRARVVARDLDASAMHVLGDDGRWALAAARNGTDCGVWDARDGRSLGTVGLDEALTMTKSPDHRFAALAGRSRITLWAAASQRPAASWSSPPGVAGGLPQFSPDSQRIAVHDRSGTVFVHDAAGGRLVVTLNAPGGFPLWDVQWTGAQRLIGIGTDGRVCEWDLGKIKQAAGEAGLRWENGETEVQ